MESKEIIKDAKLKGAKNTLKAKIKAIEQGESKSNAKVTKIKKKSATEEKIKPKSRKTVFTVKENEYNSIRDFLHNRGDKYELVVSGTTEKIRCNGKTYLSFDRTAVIRNGYFISNLVRKDVSNWLADEKNTLIERKRDYVEQKFCLENIEKNVGKLLVSIDINDCYWQTAYNLGYITQKTYGKGLEQKAWKVGRNASIGSLCKAEMITTYKGGMIMRGDDKKLQRKVIHRDERYQHVRHNIIGIVHDMFIDLARQLGEDFFMFLTDCVFTTIEKKTFVEDFFNQYGYKCKYKTFEFVNIDRNEKTVSWIELKEMDVPKYYRYSESQLFMKPQTI